MWRFDVLCEHVVCRRQCEFLEVYIVVVLSADGIQVSVDAHELPSVDFHNVVPSTLWFREET